MIDTVEIIIANDNEIITHGDWYKAGDFIGHFEEFAAIKAVRWLQDNTIFQFDQPITIEIWYETLADLSDVGEFVKQFANYLPVQCDPANLEFKFENIYPRKKEVK